MTYTKTVKSGSHMAKEVSTVKRAGGWFVKVEEFWKGESAGEVSVAGARYYWNEQAATEAAKECVAAYVAVAIRKPRNRADVIK